MHVTDTAAIVTGAASGLGAATAAELANRGARVYGFDLPAAIETALEAPEVTLIPVDVTDPSQVQGAVDQAAAGAEPSAS